MGEFLGLAAGGGMLALVGVLVAAFLEQMGFLRPEKRKRLGQCAVMAGSMVGAYWLIAALMAQMNFESLSNQARITAIFRGPYVGKMVYSLLQPSFFAPLSGLFAYAAHFLGDALFGQYMFAGVALAFGCTFFSVWLVRERLFVLFGDGFSQNASFLLLCLPFAVFFFLPGWPPVGLLMLSCVFSLAGRRLEGRNIRFSGAAFHWLMAVSLCLSAMVTAGCVFGVVG